MAGNGLKSKIYNKRGTMEPYQLNIPTKVYFGREIWREAIKYLGDFFSGKILIVTTGRSLERLGYVEELVKEIKACPFTEHVEVFDSVSANPRISEVKEGIQTGKAMKADVIVGFGGGSAMDAAKAVAAGTGSDTDIEEFFYGGKEPGRDTLPIIAIPTTAGTGSELSKAAIITDEVNKKKKGIRGTALYPQIAIVDSVFTESMPFHVTMETGFDVFAHGIESYLSLAGSPYTRMQSEYAIQTVGQYLPRLSVDLGDREAREKMSFASMIMGINLGNAGTCLPHRLQYPLGAHTDTSHGAGLAALFPAWLTCEYGYAPERIERGVSLLCGEDIYGKKKCVNKICCFIKKLGLPVSLKELGVQAEKLGVMASEVTGNIKNDPMGQENGILLKLYRMSFDKTEGLA